VDLLSAAAAAAGAAGAATRVDHERSILPQVDGVLDLKGVDFEIMQLKLECFQLLRELNGFVVHQRISFLVHLREENTSHNPTCIICITCEEQITMYST